MGKLKAGTWGVAAIALGAAVMVPVHASDQTALLIEAEGRAAAFDLAGAADLLRNAGRTDLDAQVAGVYARGLIDAREASRSGGSVESLMPVRNAIGWLEIVASGRPGPAEISRLVLQAAAAAAQSEREEMRLYLDTAIRMEMLQRAAGLPGAPLITAAEAAGELWLQVHRYAEATKAYQEAAAGAGLSPRVLAGLGRAGRGANDVVAACAAFRALLDEWEGRAELPAEVADARGYVMESCAGQGG